MYWDPVLIVDPSGPPRLGIQCIDKGAHEGPNACGEVDRFVTNDRSAASRPGGGQAPISDRVL